MLTVCKELINKDLKLAMVITGGGLGALSELTKYGGASEFLIFSHTPYCKHSSYDYLGREVDSFNSTKTAHAFAASGWKRLKRCLDAPRKGIVLGSSNVLMRSNGEREGRENSINMCVLTWEKVFYSRVTLPKMEHRCWQEEQAIIEQLDFLKDCVTKERFVQSKRFYTLEEVKTFYQGGKFECDKIENFKGTNTMSENNLQISSFREYHMRKLEPHPTEDVYVLDWVGGMLCGRGFLLSVDKETGYVTNTATLWMS